MKRASFSIALFVVACGPTAMPQDPSGSSDTTGTTGPLPTSDPTPTPATRGDTTADDTGPVTSAGFIDDPDGGGANAECSLYVQDCPAGEKCMPWESDGGGSWNATRCSPVADDPDQAGEPCTVEGSRTSGIDSCDLGIMCWDVDPQTGEGVCVDMCIGVPSNPVCDDPDTQCITEASGLLNLCLPSCDPVAPQCPDGQGCYPLNDLFTCATDASEGGGAPGDPCEFINVCEPGTFCTNPAVNTTTCLDPGALGCCVPYCHLDMPSCANGEACIPFYDPGDEPVGYEHVGLCGTG